MQQAVQLFIMSSDRQPQPAESFSVEGDSIDALRGAVLDELQDRKLRLQSMSFGPQRMVVYAELAV